MRNFTHNYVTISVAHSFVILQTNSNDLAIVEKAASQAGWKKFSNVDLDTEMAQLKMELQVWLT